MANKSRSQYTTIFHPQKCDHSGSWMFNVGNKSDSSCEITEIGNKRIAYGHPGIVKMKSLARIHVWWPEPPATQ